MIATAVPVTEAQFQAQVVELAQILGWTVNHHRKSLGGRKAGWVTATTLKGMPDLMLIRPPRLVFAELKAELGKLTAEQVAVLDLLRRCDGVEAFCWRPSEFDHVAKVLR
jgi:hypothetical protein